jgi:hypothetical protein
MFLLKLIRAIGWETGSGDLALSRFSVSEIQQDVKQRHCRRNYWEHAAGAFVRRYGLGSASNSQRAVETLLKRDLLNRDNGFFLITDRFFRIWIQQKQMQ